MDDLAVVRFLVGVLHDLYEREARRFAPIEKRWREEFEQFEESVSTDDADLTVEQWQERVRLHGEVSYAIAACGCSGARIDAGGWRVEEEAFLCTRRHKQGDLVLDNVAELLDDLDELGGFPIAYGQEAHGELHVIAAAALRAVQAEALEILGRTAATEGGRQFPLRSRFDGCLSFLARLSGDDRWAFLVREDGANRG
jgi:hypothetical protein